MVAIFAQKGNGSGAGGTNYNRFYMVGPNMIVRDTDVSFLGKQGNIISSTGSEACAYGNLVDGTNYQLEMSYSKVSDKEQFNITINLYNLDTSASVYTKTVAITSNLGERYNYLLSCLEKDRYVKLLKRFYCLSVNIGWRSFYYFYRCKIIL